MNFDDFQSILCYVPTFVNFTPLSEASVFVSVITK